MKKHIMTLGVVPAIVLTALLAACSTGSTPSDSNSAPADAATIDALVQEYEAAVANTNPDIVVEPLSASAPTGKTLEIITCPVPICALYTEGAEAAAKELGWTTTTVVAPFTPEGFKETWETVLQHKPDAVVMAAVQPSATVIDQVQQAADAGTVVVAYGLDVKAGGDSPFVFGTTSPEALGVDGHEQGLVVVNDARAAADVLVVTDPSQVVMKAQVAASTKVLESIGSTVDVLEVGSGEIGKGVPTQIVTYLQAHPKVQYVILPNDDFLSGVPQALKSAGLENVKLIGEAVSNESAPSIESGELLASTAHPVLINGWYLVDAIVRTMVGDKIADPNPLWESAIVTKENVSEFGDLHDWPRVQDEFTSAWGVN